MDPVASDWQQDLARCGPKALLREQSLWAIGVYRLGRRVMASRAGPAVARAVLLKLLWQVQGVVETVTGIGLPFGVQAGGGLRIHHFGGVFINNGAVLGSNCTLRQGNTIGEREPGGPTPVLGNGVELGAYAQVLGGVKVGDGAVIGAMSLVLDDVGSGVTVYGIPAKPGHRHAE